LTQPNVNDVEWFRSAFTNAEREVGREAERHRIPPSNSPRADSANVQISFRHNFTRSFCYGTSGTLGIYAGRLQLVIRIQFPNRETALFSARFPRASDFPETANGIPISIGALYLPELTPGFPVESCSSSRSQLTSARETTLSSARRRRATRECTPRDHYKYSRTVCAGNTDQSISIVNSEVIIR